MANRTLGRRTAKKIPMTVASAQVRPKPTTKAAPKAAPKATPKATRRVAEDTDKEQEDEISRLKGMFENELTLVAETSLSI